MDEQNRIILRQAGMLYSEHLVGEDYEGGAYLVSVLWDGALEDEWLVHDLGVAQAQAAAIRAAEGDDVAELEILVNHVYVGPDTVEGSGYGEQLRF